MSSFAPSRPYALLAPAALDLLLAAQPGPTYLRALCVLRAGVLVALTFHTRWRRRGLYLTAQTASVMACVWESCKSTLYKTPADPSGGGTGGGGDWDEWYGPEASGAFLAETCALALGEILLFISLKRLTPRYPPPPSVGSSGWPLTPETPSPGALGRLTLGSLRANSAHAAHAAHAPTRPSPLGPPSPLSTCELDPAGPANDEHTEHAEHGTSPSPVRPGPPTRSFSGSGKEREPTPAPSDAGADAEADADESTDLLAPLRLPSSADLPAHTVLRDDECDGDGDGYDSSASESSIIDMPRRRMRPFDAESIGEVAENAGASVISVVAGIGGMVRRSASRSLLGTSPGYGTFDAV